jgi:hypothetical protein
VRCVGGGPGTDRTARREPAAPQIDEPNNGRLGVAHGAYLCRNDPSWHQLLKNAVNAGISVCQFASYVAGVPADQNALLPAKVGLDQLAKDVLVACAGSAERVFAHLPSHDTIFRRCESAGPSSAAPVSQKR